MIFKYFFCYRVFAPSSLIFYIKLCTLHVQKLLSYAYLIWVLLFPFVGPSVPLMPISSISLSEVCTGNKLNTTALGEPCIVFYPRTMFAINAFENNVIHIWAFITRQRVERRGQIMRIIISLLLYCCHCVMYQSWRILWGNIGLKCVLFSVNILLVLIFYDILSIPTNPEMLTE